MTLWFSLNAWDRPASGLADVREYIHESSPGNPRQELAAGDDHARGGRTAGGDRRARGIVGCGRSLTFTRGQPASERPHPGRPGRGRRRVAASDRPLRVSGRAAAWGDVGRPGPAAQSHPTSCCDSSPLRSANRPRPPDSSSVFPRWQSQAAYMFAVRSITKDGLFRAEYEGLCQRNGVRR